MKKILLIAFIFSFSFARSWVSTTSQYPSQPIWDLNQVSNDHIEISFKLGGYYLEELIDGENKITFPGSVPLLEEGAPQLPIMARSIIIPDNAKMNLDILKSEFVDFNLKSIEPSKGNLTRNIDPKSIPYSYGNVYKTDAFYPENISFSRDPYILRSFRGQAIVFQPIQYNPVKKILRVYSEIKIRVQKTGDGEINVLSKRPAVRAVQEFHNIYKNQFINYPSEMNYEALSEQGPLLIISHGDFLDEMQSFVDWKNYKGIPTSIVDVSEIGDVDQMKLYIEDKYYEEGIAYVLLVGDIDQIDAIRRNNGAGSNSPSDNSQTFIAGSDAYPDLMIGRFSAETSSQVQTMINRTISYEMNPDPDGEWYKKGSGFASDQGPGDDGEYDDEHLDNIRELLLDYNYNEIDQIYDPSGTVADGEQAINEGRSIINYTGHGSNGSWGNGCPMNNTNVNGLVNVGMYPFIWSVACVNGEFEQGTCFAETWIRATNDDGEPTGAIATLMSTVNQAWMPPMEGQDEMNDIFVESFDQNIKRTFGGLSFNGMNQMNDSYGSQGYDETYYWTIFGDPSVVVRSDTPSEIEVSHTDVIIVGESSFSVLTDEIGSLVAISRDGTLLASGFTNSNGSILFEFDDPFEIPGSLDIVVTGYNKIPYENMVNIIAPDGAYMHMTQFSLNESEENMLSYGSQGSLYFTFQNVGQDTSSELNFTLYHDSSAANVITETITHEPVIPEDELIIGPFIFEMDWNNQNNSNVPFIIEVTDDTNVWSYEMNIGVHAPEFNLISVTYVDNENGSLDPGETANVELIMHNFGDADVSYPTFQIITSDEYLTIGSISQENAYWWGIDENIMINIEISASADAPIGHSAMAGVLIGSLNTEFESVYPLPITLGVLVEDFETQSFSSMDWINDESNQWFIDQESYSGLFSARSGEINDDQKSELSIMMNVLYEGEISFWAKVSSEQNSGDVLDFYINDQSQDLNINGNSDWEQYSISLPTGTHLLRWVYQKDDYQSSGQDCAWIDLIQFPAGAVQPLNIDFGDLNFDDLINVFDVIVSVNSIMGNLDLSDEQYQNGDINLDGIIDVMDILAIVDMILEN